MTGRSASLGSAAPQTSAAASAIAWYSAAISFAERMPARRRISSRSPWKFWPFPHSLRPSHISVAPVWFSMSPASFCAASAPFTYSLQPFDVFFWNVRAKCPHVPAVGTVTLRSWSFLPGVVIWIWSLPFDRIETKRFFPNSAW